MIRFLAFLVVSIILPHETSAEEIRSQLYGYTLKLPEGWKVMTEAQLNAMQTPSVKFNYGINSMTPDQSLTYLLLRTIPDRVKNFTFDQLEKSLEREMNLKVVRKEIEKQNLNDVIRDVKLGTAVLDRQKKRFVFQIDMDIMGAVKLRCQGFGMLANDGVTFLYCYSPKESFDQQLDGFYKVAEGFSFDANREYVEPSGSAFGNAFQGGISGGLIGGVIGGLVVAVLAIVKKLKNSSSKASTETMN